MSYNDGSKLVVFGRSFAQQDSRKMQHVLGHYHRLPNSSNRAVLFAHLNTLANDLMADDASQHDIHAIAQWMQDQAPFPFPTNPTPAPRGASRSHYRHGRGRTLADLATEDTPTAANDEEDQDDDGAEEEFDEMDPLPRWQRRLRRPFYGQGHRLEEPETPQHQDDGQAIETENDEPENRHDDTSNQDIDMENDQTEPHENQPANHSTHVHHQDTEVEDPPPGVPHTEAGDRIVECPICAEDYPTTNFPRDATITEACTHPEKACLDCLEASIAAVIERGALHLLACPICPSKLSSRNVEQYGSSQIYQRYKYLKEQSEIPGHYISCMNPNCGGSQPHEADDPRMICRYCNFATCAHHRRPWHEGQKCSEFDLDDAQLERLEEEEATAKLLAKEETSICPKCGQGVTKTEGCDHMSCTCGEEWCYICSCSYENVLRLGAIAHATFCIYHPNKVNLTKTQKEAAREKIMGLVHGGEVSAELARARDELRERRRAEMRPKVAEAAEARRKLAMQQQRGSGGGSAADQLHKRKKVKLVAPWEEGGRTKRYF